MDLSVVIPCYNAARTLPHLLESLTQQSLDRARYEIIVVDDGSDDGSQEIAQRVDGVKLLQQHRRGPGVARNLGTETARGRYVLYLDSDLDVAPNLLAVHLDHITRQPGLAATGGSVLPAGRTPLFSWTLVDHLCSWFNAHPAVTYPTPPEYLPSLNFCIDRSIVVDRLGLTWEAGLEHTGEDVLYCHALRQHGQTMLFLPDAVVYHQDRDTLAGYWKHMYRWGYHAPYVRGRLKDLKFSFLFQPQPWKQALLLPAIVAGYTLLVWKSWLASRPLQATLSLPQIFLGRIAYALGVQRATQDRAQAR